MTTPQVYLVDDDADLREAMMETFEMEKIAAQAFSSGGEMLDELDPEWEGVIISDIRMPGMTGFDLLGEVEKLSSDIPVVMITGHGEISSAIKAMKLGAFDYVEKPAAPEFLISVLRRALKLRQLQLENKRLRSRMAKGGDIRARLLGRSKVMRQCRSEIVNVAPLAVNVLIYGESGTGKELAARCLHDQSIAKGEFVVVSCSDLTPENFDHKMCLVDENSPGAIIRAKSGTLFLDGVTELPASLQMRFVEMIHAGNMPRIIAATSESQATAAERLRPDLYYRLNVAEILLPPLRERGNDVFVLLEFFVREAASRFQRKLPDVTADDLRPFKTHHWPGNVRELRNMAERLVIGLKVQFTPAGMAEAATSKPYDDAMRDFERELLQAALVQSGGQKGEAAANLKIPRKRFYLRMRAVGLLEKGQ
ncbi:MAG: sigma-54 dependent transcriptional regulator [Paracoccaceae bacterium]